MNLKIDKGYNTKTSNERITLIATGDGDTSNYLVLDTTFDAKGNPSNKFKHCFRFPQKKFNRGDLIRLYSRRGENKSEVNSNSPEFMIHSFYWEVKFGIWNENGDNITLMRIAETRTKKVVTP